MVKRRNQKIEVLCFFLISAMLSCALRMSKDGSIALFNFRVADDLLPPTVCLWRDLRACYC